MSDEVEVKKKKPILLIVIIVVLFFLLLVGGLVAYLVLDSTPQTQQQVTQMNTPQQQQQSRQRSQDYINIGKIIPLEQFTVNLVSDSGSRFLKTSVNLELSVEMLEQEIDKKKPLIRDLIIRILSSKTYEEVGTSKGKERLKDEMASRLNEVLTDGFVKNIYFTDFVVQ